MTDLILPDCSEIDEDAIVKAISNASGYNETKEGNQNSPLKTLSLHHCGHCFTSWSVQQLLNRGVLSGISLLTLTGLYRLNDTTCAQLIHGIASVTPNPTSLSAVPPASSLRHLDLSYAMGLGSQTLTTISNNATTLSRLILDYTNLSRESILILCASCYAMPCLSELSLAGQDTLTDSLFAYLLDGDAIAFQNRDGDIPPWIPRCPSPTSSVHIPFGPRLSLLSIRECHSLSNPALATIHTFCRKLQHLDLSGVINFTAPALKDLFIWVRQFPSPP